MEFGPEIKVDGIRPECLDGYNGFVKWWNEDQPQGVVCRNAALLNWGPYPGFKRGACTSFALPANHSHYTTPTRTPLEDRIVAPELVERMRKLLEVAAGRFLGSGSDIYEEARAILAEMEPVDEDLVIARETVASIWELSRGESGLQEWHRSKAIREGKRDDSLDVKAALDAIKRGRQLEKEGK